jgi:spore coat polysaccharide biosynthesis protein SpsF (cytidylyltransferase family)
MIVAAIQVRMDSTRLPGKALVEVEGRPLLWHIVNRLRFTRSVDQIVIATSREPDDAPIRDFASKHSIPCYGGSKLDLIGRIYNSALYAEAHALVRITGDCPLTDPGVVDEMVHVFLNRSDDVDYITNDMPPTYPDGLDVEVYSVATLKRLHDEITDPFFREWFPLYLKDHKKSFRSHNVNCLEDLSSLRWTVDYEEDLLFVREVYRRLYRDRKIFTMKDVLELIKAEPEIAEINKNHTRNEGSAIALASEKEMHKESNER